MDEREKQRRPPRGPSYLADDAFRERLHSLLAAGKSSGLIASEVAELGYRCDPSMIRKLDTGASPSGQVVGYICKRYGWPLPPRTHEDAKGMDAVISAMEELRAADPDQFAKIVRMVLRARDQVRDFADSDRATPEKPSG